MYTNQCRNIMCVSVPLAQYQLLINIYYCYLIFCFKNFIVILLYHDAQKKLKTMKNLQYLSSVQALVKVFIQLLKDFIS